MTIFCPFNYTSICWCMIEISSDLLRSSSEIFGYLRKMFGTLVWPSELRKIYENLWKAVGNLLEVATNVVMYCEFLI